MQEFVQKEITSKSPKPLELHGAGSGAPAPRLQALAALQKLTASCRSARRGRRSSSAAAAALCEAWTGILTSYT